MNFEARSVGRARIREDQRIVLDHVRLRNEDFTSRKLVQFAAIGSRLVSCRFAGSRIEDAAFGSGLEASEYADCVFDRCRIRFGPGGHARFVGCSFREVDLREWFCFTVELIDCTFSGRLRGAIFNGTVPEEKRALLGRERNEFRGNDFSQMDLVDVAFRTGIDLTRQRLPQDPRYVYLPDAVVALQQARAACVGWDDLELRRSAMALLRNLEYEIEGGQRQLLLRRDDYSSLNQTATERAFALLRNQLHPPS